jgi:hypothetical protein
MSGWERDSGGQIRCAPSTSLLQNFTSITHNGSFVLGSADDPNFHLRLSEGGTAIARTDEPAPAGWEKRTSITNGREYFHNPGTGNSLWANVVPQRDEGQAQIVKAMRVEFRQRQQAFETRQAESRLAMSNPFGSGAIEYDTRTFAPAGGGRLEQRESLVRVAKAVNRGGLRGSGGGGGGSSTQTATMADDQALVRALRTIKRRVTSGEAEGQSLGRLLLEAGRPSIGASKGTDSLAAAPTAAAASTNTARSAGSVESVPTARFQKVQGAMVNVLSTSRIEKQLARNRRRMERFERQQVCARQPGRLSARQPPGLNMRACVRACAACAAAAGADDLGEVQGRFHCGGLLWHRHQVPLHPRGGHLPQVRGPRRRLRRGPSRGRGGGALPGGRAAAGGRRPARLWSRAGHRHALPPLSPTPW